MGKQTEVTHALRHGRKDEPSPGPPSWSLEPEGRKNQAHAVGHTGCVRLQQCFGSVLDCVLSCSRRNGSATLKLDAGSVRISFWQEKRERERNINSSYKSVNSVYVSFLFQEELEIATKFLYYEMGSKSRSEQLTDRSEISLLPSDIDRYF